MFACSVWGVFSKNYNSFLASRIISGFGMAPYEVLVQCTIGDLYFVHQRATRIAAWNLFLLCGISGGSLVSGYIIEVCLDVLGNAEYFTDEILGYRMEMDVRNMCHLLRHIYRSCPSLRPRDCLHTDSYPTDREE